MSAGLFRTTVRCAPQCSVKPRGRPIVIPSCHRRGPAAAVERYARREDVSPPQMHQQCQIIAPSGISQAFCRTFPRPVRTMLLTTPTNVTPPYLAGLQRPAVEVALQDILVFKDVHTGTRRHGVRQ